MNSQIILWSVVSALAGFLFGFDTVVISGAEQEIQALWRLSPGLHGLAMASALYGTVIGSMIGGFPIDRFGRKPTLIAIGILYLGSAIWSALATGVYSFSVARAIGGLGIGMSTVAAPLYISEIAPAGRRGLLAGMFQFNIVFGIVVAYASNAMLAGAESGSWRWMLGVAAMPAALYTVSCLVLPESPRWLLARRGDRAAALGVLRLISPQANAEELVAEADEIANASRDRAGGGYFWSRALRKPILLAFLIAFFNQLSGINAVLYFAPRILEMAGLAKHSALLQSVGIGLTNLAFTFVGLWLIDRIGRRTLLYIGSVGYIISLGLVSWAFHTQTVSIVPACLFAFIAAHAIGQGTVIWVYLSEIFPTQYRGEGQAFGCSTHWVFAALLTTFFPRIVAAYSPTSVFLFFCVMMVLQLVWVKIMVVETKGVPLEHVQRQLGLVGP